MPGLAPLIIDQNVQSHKQSGNAGMPSENVYSIAQKKYGFPYQGYAWNLFFPKKQQEITVDGVNIFVENVTPDEIRLRIG